jgi:ABC-type bacteriocin/lantibiotic exporter with double-glycine peptidase domain
MAEEYSEDEEVVDNEVMYPVKPIEQSVEWDCGPTALRIVLKYQFALKLTAQEMITLTGATEGGADEYNLMRALDILGFKYRQSERGTFGKLKHVLADGQIPIAHIILRDGVGHYVVICGYDEENVYFADPSSGKIVKYGIPFFLGVWKVEENETQTRWYLAVTGYGGDKLDSVLARYKRIQKKVRNSRK